MRLRKRALEGTFLGPGVIAGRMAGRSAVADLGIAPPAAKTEKPSPKLTMQTMPSDVDSATCTGCHDLKRLVDKPREGYWHFERVHRKVLEQKYECVQCHADLSVLSI